MIKAKFYCKDAVNSERLCDFLAANNETYQAWIALRTDIFLQAQDKEVYCESREFFYYPKIAKDFERYYSCLKPIILVFHIDESNEEHKRMYEFLKKSLLIEWTEYVSKEEADKYVDKLFKNNIPYIENRG